VLLLPPQALPAAARSPAPPAMYNE
jgi:hypothetical protein